MVNQGRRAGFVYLGSGWLLNLHVCLRVHIWAPSGGLGRLHLSQFRGQEQWIPKAGGLPVTPASEIRGNQSFNWKVQTLPHISHWGCGCRQEGTLAAVPMPYTFKQESRSTASVPPVMIIMCIAKSCMKTPVRSNSNVL